MNDTGKTGNGIEICVFPAAGLGTRFLPATKDIPKEMLPLLDRPIIHYGVSEAVDSGCKRIVFITGVGKDSIRNYFSPNPRLVALLREQGRNELADCVEGISELAVFHFVNQPKPRGLGDAIRRAEKICSAFDYFGIILPDDVIRSEKPALSRLDSIRHRFGGSVVALEEVPGEQVDRYGIAEAEETEPGVYRISALVEKPGVGTTRSNLALIGRYVLSSKIFKHLKKLAPGAGGELQLTDAMSAMLDEEPLWGVKCDGERLDCGTIPGWIRATETLARRHPEYKDIWKD